MKTYAQLKSDHQRLKAEHRRLRRRLRDTQDALRDAENDLQWVTEQVEQRAAEAARKRAAVQMFLRSLSAADHARLKQALGWPDVDRPAVTH